MNKNEIVAKWMGWPKCTCGMDDRHYVQGPLNYQVVYPEHMKFDSSYDWLHEAWVKFRDLKFEKPALNSTHRFICKEIKFAITEESITEAFDELVKGIEWYNNLKK